MNGHPDSRPDVVVDWPPPRRPPRRRGRLFVLAVLAVLILGASTTLSYYVDALWFGSLGYSAVFWTTLNTQAVIFLGFAVMTFVVLYGAFLALKPPRLGEFSGVLINGEPLKLPVEPVLKLIALGVALAVAAVSGAGMMAEWTTLALYWHAPVSSSAVDPIFGRPISFYLFTLPAWQLISGWLMTLAVMTCAIAGFFIVVTGGTRLMTRQRTPPGPRALWRGLSIAFAALLLILAVRVYLGRFEELFQDQVIFAGVTYTDAHVTLTGMLAVSIALVLGAAIALANAVSAPRVSWLVASVAPAVLCYAVVGVLGWYVNSFIVKPNELVKEQPYISNNIAMTREAYGLNRVEQHPFPAETGIEAVDAPNNQMTLQNVRLWDWRALQDTLRQIQEIRTYYDFPDIDIDRYETGGTVKQMMLAARELSIEKLPESSRNWINEKLIYTHGYGLTMNPVNGFTPEGLPALILSNMPVQSTIPDIKVTRPEIYFGELTNADVYVKTRQKEFNFPQGDTNNLTSYEGDGGIRLGGFLRRLLIALDRGDLAKLPFSDDITPDSRLLMRRSITDRVDALASFLTYDPDPYVVLSSEGRIFWMLDAYTTSGSYPYSRHYRLGRGSINYIRNSVKVVIDAYDGSTTFYVFDNEDPIVGAYRALFPTLFRDASAMPAGLRKHVRYPELLLKLQASVYGLYHMTNPGVFYNREDLWSVASEVGLSAQREQATQAMEPNYVLMKLPEGRDIEFVGILPFTPASKNNLIGWFAGRSDGEDYGKAIVFDFPKTKLVDGPLQIEARIDQNAQLSGQLSLWNQQGSHVRRGSLIVMPIGRALLYAEAIYLQAERSPMPELRLVVLALQDRLAYAPTFEGAMAGLFGGGISTTSASAAPPVAASRAPAAPTPPGEAPPEANTLISGAAQDLADYQRLTADGKLADAGRKLEDLKRKLEQLAAQRR